MISHEQKPYRLDSVIMRPAITICQGTSAPRARYRPRKSLRHHSCRHHICPPINKQERAVALLVSNCKTSIATTRYPNCFPSYWGRRRQHIFETYFNSSNVQFELFRYSKIEDSYGSSGRVLQPMVIQPNPRGPKGNAGDLKNISEGCNNQQLNILEIISPFRPVPVTF